MDGFYKDKLLSGAVQTQMSQAPLFLALVREKEYAHMDFESHSRILKDMCECMFVQYIFTTYMHFRKIS